MQSFSNSIKTTHLAVCMVALGLMRLIDHQALDALCRQSATTQVVGEYLRCKEENAPGLPGALALRGMHRACEMDMLSLFYYNIKTLNPWVIMSYNFCTKSYFNNIKRNTNR